MSVVQARTGVCVVRGETAIIMTDLPVWQVRRVVYVVGVGYGVELMTGAVWYADAHLRAWQRCTPGLSWTITPMLDSAHTDSFRESTPDVMEWLRKTIMDGEDVVHAVAQVRTLAGNRGRIRALRRGDTIKINNYLCTVVAIPVENEQENPQWVFEDTDSVMLVRTMHELMAATII